MVRFTIFLAFVATLALVAGVAADADDVPRPQQGGNGAARTTQQGGGNAQRGEGMKIQNKSKCDVKVTMKMMGMANEVVDVKAGTTKVMNNMNNGANEQMTGVQVKGQNGCNMQFAEFAGTKTNPKMIMIDADGTMQVM